MARLKSLPSLEIIKGFKGVIDFAVYRGVPIARSWPFTPRHHLTAATLASAAIFGEVLSAYRLLFPLLHQLLTAEAADQPRTARDIYTQALYGYLHENQMSDIVDLLTAIDGHLVDLQTILSLEAGGNLDSILASLQTIEGFALPTNKLFGYFDTELEAPTVAGTGDSPAAYSTEVPPEEVWIITDFATYHSDPTPRTVVFHIDRAGTAYHMDQQVALAQWAHWAEQGAWTLKAGDKIGCRYYNLAVGTTGFLFINGYKMKIA